MTQPFRSLPAHIQNIVTLQINIDINKYWYEATSAKPTSKQIQLSSNFTLNSTTPYSVIFGEQLTGASINGSINAMVAISKGTSDISGGRKDYKTYLNIFQ